ncbi:hypothetical protein RM543_10345 [Roseicyclus sp. F158]|uniref:TonB-dependent receptor n=1 Tax=Tropicimonas omnivorans TaxID=3075590 RepID=A0ABU3DH89_9RHOB|nr:hypothetical protein [Roseicyclus sp. F158]MDT0683086.1 hypothetical protein [Roseicyclus sp. F158]
MFENAFNNDDRALRNDEGATLELNYASRWHGGSSSSTSTTVRRDEAELKGKDYSPIVDTAYSWKIGAAPGLRSYACADDHIFYAADRTLCK